MKIANWNIEWMNDWFTPISAGAPGWRQNNPRRGITDVAALAGRVAGVIQALDPDVLTIQEGPSRKGEMDLFVADFLGGAYEVFGPTGRHTQRLFTLVRSNGAVEHAERIWPEPAGPGSVYNLGRDVDQGKLALFLLQVQVSAGSGRVIPPSEISRRP